MEPDLSASITKHPHPFRLESSPPSRSPSRPPHSPAVGSSAAALSDGIAGASNNNNGGSSTGVEVKAANDDDATVERHPLANPTSPSGTAATDVESQTTAGAGGAGRIPNYSAENDPYGLASAYKTDSDLAEIKPTGARKRPVAAAAGSSTTGGVVGGNGVTAIAGGNAGGNDGAKRGGLLARCMPFSLPSFPSLPSLPSAPALPMMPSARRALRTRKLKGFYKTQNAAIERMLKTVEEHQAEARQEQGDDQLKYRIAVYGSFVANLVLAGLQIYGAVSSGSLSLFTTMADAIFDPMSNLTLIVTNRAVRRVDPARFPSGKARLETVGNIGFCFLMTGVSFILIALSANELAGGRDPDEATTKKFHLPSVLAVAIAFVTKLALFLYTWAIKDKYSQVYILWQDHRNDLLINGFGLLTSVGGSKLVWWLDPAGAIVLGVTVSTIWLKTAFAEFLLLVGVVASVETQQLITYVCLTHSPSVRQIDTVRVYHSGPRLIAEVDVVMSPNATLAETHDVAESLQSKLECLPDIERAYVHVDYETTHKPEHTYKKEI